MEVGGVEDVRKSRRYGTHVACEAGQEHVDAVGWEQLTVLPPRLLCVERQPLVDEVWIVVPEYVGWDLIVRVSGILLVVLLQPPSEVGHGPLVVLQSVMSVF